MNSDLMIAVIRAHSRGDSIQWRRRCSDKWEKLTTREYPFDFLHLEYRVRPEPREYWAEVLPSGGIAVHDQPNSLTEGGELIRLREVME